jgi:hypothetical protein
LIVFARAAAIACLRFNSADMEQSVMRKTLWTMAGAAILVAGTSSLALAQYSYQPAPTYAPAYGYQPAPTYAPGYYAPSNPVSGAAAGGAAGAAAGGAAGGPVGAIVGGAIGTATGAVGGTANAVTGAPVYGTPAYPAYGSSYPPPAAYPPAYGYR